LSPVTKQLQASVVITYTNNSPDALRQVAIHLRQNLHREGVVRNRPQQLTGGVKLGRVRYNDAPMLEIPTIRGSTVGYVVSGTLMQVKLPEAIPSGGTATFAIDYSFEVPEAGAPRMGQDGEVFYLGYWYPQMAVYDDMDGWVADPYMGNGEFYMGYADYDVRITVPEGWLIGATGTLQNPDDVLAEQTQQRLADAAQSRETTAIVSEDDRQAGASTLDTPANTITWHYKAENVRDFAFGTSDQYLWDATHATVNAADGEKTVMLHSLYRPGTAAWERSAEYGQFSIEFMSERFFPYPYPHMTAVEGVIGGGMEFPMITLIGGTRTPQSLFGVTFHEIAHMWFPMVVGQNEKRFTWMDEGLTSFNTSEASAAFWQADSWNPGRQSYYFIAGTGNEVESMRHGDRYPVGTPARGIASYNKPAVALHALRGLFGDEKFYAAYAEYARRWTYKHPQPFDLFNTFEDVLGQDLDWFWTSLLYETWTLDHAVQAVESGRDGVEVVIADNGLTPMPALVRITYADGTTDEGVVPVQTWLDGNRTARLRFDAGTVTRVELDPNLYLPDIDRANNTWAR
ncbi:MAG: M1 family metallopeptidase, partial [Bacteroidota bacterium]